MRKFKNITNRIFVLYFAIFLMGYFFIDREKLYVSRAFVLNRMAPNPTDYLYQLSADPHLYDQRVLEEHILYYQKLDEIFPDRAEILGTLGLCYFYTGEIKKSIDMYKKTIHLRNNFFWYLYNLGVIYFNQGEYSKAALLLGKTTDTNPVEDFNYLYNNKVFLDIKYRLANEFDNPSEVLRRSYLRAKYDAIKMIMLSHFYLEDYGTVLYEVNREVEYKDIKPEDKFFFCYYGGLSALKLNMNLKAASLFRKVLMIEPEHPYALHYFSVALSKAGREAEAKKVKQRLSYARMRNNYHAYEKVEFYPKIF